ncbi:MAG: molybdenum cofactor biosynthesis protein MoaE [Candidatus Hydrothermarchaeaceae archaeon]
MENIRILEEDFSVDAEIKRIKAVSGRIGGIVTFLGTVRDFSRGKEVKKLVFEHYPDMAVEKMKELREKALEKFKIIEVSMLHRKGEIEIGENIALIVVAAEHRKDAFLACMWLIDELKKVVPIWKKEITTEGDIWVEEHT